MYIIGLYDLEGNYLDSFNSINDLSLFLKINVNLIYNCINNNATILSDKFQIIKKTSKTQLPHKLGDVSNIK